MAKCTCDYPVTEYSTWTGHSPLCPIEKEVRESPRQRVKQTTQHAEPPNLPKWLRRALEEVMGESQ